MIEANHSAIMLHMITLSLEMTFIDVSISSKYLINSKLVLTKIKETLLFNLSHNVFKTNTLIENDILSHSLVSPEMIYRWRMAYFKFNKHRNCILSIIIVLEKHSERSDECIDFTMIITSRNNASISNFGGGFRWKSEYPWCIIELFEAKLMENLVLNFLTITYEELCIKFTTTIKTTYKKPCNTFSRFSGQPKKIYQKLNQSTIALIADCRSSGSESFFTHNDISLNSNLTNPLSTSLVTLMIKIGFYNYIRSMDNRSIKMGLYGDMGIEHLSDNINQSR
ncbi:hypothetical protein AGLY_010369 [Aphis glycines]|uniref:Uncharacterized protein n=1 Tax=Aphis glycines TaxID=307491 RepID=A0A6G0TH40_APHGL|nr:hypothetical protein AGLY_010369 [Aphis glycines]